MNIEIQIKSGSKNVCLLFDGHFFARVNDIGQQNAAIGSVAQLFHNIVSLHSLLYIYI